MIVADGWEQGTGEEPYKSAISAASSSVPSSHHAAQFETSGCTGGQWQYRSAISASSSSGLSFHQAAHCETSDGTNGEWQYGSATAAASSSGLSFHHAAQLEISDCTAARPVFEPQKEDSVVTGVPLCFCRSWACNWETSPGLSKCEAICFCKAGRGVEKAQKGQASCLVGCTSVAWPAHGWRDTSGHFPLIPLLRACCCALRLFFENRHAKRTLVGDDGMLEWLP